MREVQNLSRLRNSIVLDTRVDERARAKALAAIDELIRIVRVFAAAANANMTAA
jgi:hypothetical protein